METRMEKMEDEMMTERRKNQYKIELLEHKVIALESQLKKARQVLPPAQPAPVSSTTFHSCNTCGHRAPTTHILKAHMANAHPYPPKITKAPSTECLLPCNLCNYRASSGPDLKAHTNELHHFKCQQCGAKTTSLPDLDKHISEKHGQQQTNTETTMMIGDSNMKTVNCRIVETALGGDKLLCGRWTLLDLSLH